MEIKFSIDGESFIDLHSFLEISDEDCDSKLAESFSEKLEYYEEVTIVNDISNFIKHANLHDKSGCDKYLSELGYEKCIHDDHSITLFNVELLKDSAKSKLLFIFEKYSFLYKILFVALNVVNCGSLSIKFVEDALLARDSFIILYDNKEYSLQEDVDKLYFKEKDVKEINN